MIIHHLFKTNKYKNEQVLTTLSIDAESVMNESFFLYALSDKPWAQMSVTHHSIARFKSIPKN
jgi:hypothetical protein